jgi:hypothetical protein
MPWAQDALERPTYSAWTARSSAAITSAGDEAEGLQRLGLSAGRGVEIGADVDRAHTPAFEQHARRFQAATTAVQADIHECEIGTLACRGFHGFCWIACYRQHPVAGPFDEIAEVPRNEHLVFDDQYGGRHDTAD